MSNNLCRPTPNLNRYRPQGRVVATQLQKPKGPKIPCLAQQGTCSRICPCGSGSKPTPVARVGTGVFAEDILRKHRRRDCFSTQ